MVKLRFFVGLTSAQAAEVLGISSTTADNDWAYARSWLRVELDGAAQKDGREKSLLGILRAVFALTVGGLTANSSLGQLPSRPSWRNWP